MYNAPHNHMQVLMITWLWLADLGHTSLIESYTDQTCIWMYSILCLKLGCFELRWHHHMRIWAKNRYLRHGLISTSWSLLWKVITYPCPDVCFRHHRNPHVPKSSYWGLGAKLWFVHSLAITSFCTKPLIFCNVYIGSGPSWFKVRSRRACL